MKLSKTPETLKNSQTFMILMYLEAKFEYIYILRLFINSSSEIVNKKFHIISTNIVAMVAFYVFFYFLDFNLLATIGHQNKYNNTKIHHRRFIVL